jgi:hypothetical protein
LPYVSRRNFPAKQRLNPTSTNHANTDASSRDGEFDEYLEPTTAIH